MKYAFVPKKGLLKSQILTKGVFISDAKYISFYLTEDLKSRYNLLL
jgi:hypothetical protein